MPSKGRPVGQYIEKFNVLTGQNIPLGTIFQSDGLRSHVAKRHPAEVNNLNFVEQVINSPDYVGHNPKEPDSIELVKTLGNNVMVCVKLDSANGYLFVASVFNITNAKLQNRIKTGRLKKY